MLLLAVPALGGFPFSYSLIRSHPCPHICNQPYWLLQFSAGWASPRYLGPVAFSCQSCWGTAQVFFYNCLHARCTSLAAYLSADTISYYHHGLLVCPSLRPLLPLWPLLPSVVFAAHGLLRSAARGEPLVHLTTVQRRAFLFAGPSAWNDLPIELHSLTMATLPNFTSPWSPS